MSDAERETGRRLDIKFNEQGLVPAIVQDAQSGAVLMVGWMNDKALEQTLSTRRATFYSRSRNKMWVKGEESGHIQEVLEARVDCDQDVVLLRCRSHGPACHVGYATCFFRTISGPTEAAERLQVAEKQVFDPKSVYKK